MDKLNIMVDIITTLVMWIVFAVMWTNIVGQPQTSGDYLIVMALFVTTNFIHSFLKIRKVK